MHCQNLPEFEELHHVEKDHADKLLKQEIDRLRDAANQPVSEPSHWRSEPLGSPQQGEISRSTLLQAAHHLWCNMAVLRFKNDLILLEHTRFCSQNVEVKAMYARALLSLRTSRAVILSHFVQASPFIATQRMPPLQPDTVEARTYDQLVDYISASIYRLVVNSASGQSWTHTTMAVLARISRKLKDLKTNAARCAEECIDATEFLLADLKDENAEAQKRFVFEASFSAPVDVLDDTYFIRRYFTHGYQYRWAICLVISSILNPIRENLSTEGSISLRDNCEFSTLIEGANGVSALVVDSQRHGDVRTTSSQIALTFSYNACRLLLPLAEDIRKRNSKQHDIQGRAGIRWWWQRRQPGATSAPLAGQGLAHLTDLGDCLSTIVHMALTTSNVSNAMLLLADHLISLPGGENELSLVEPPEGCRLAFTLSGSIARHEAWQEDSDVMSLSAYNLRQQSSELADEHTLTPGMALRARYRAVQGSMHSWVIDSEAIVIKCRVVAAVIIVPALLMTGGGVALLLAPYPKPAGVDPSNFMVFLWSLAISYLLIAKAFFVPDWPWHDFLRAEVYCRSINEVRRITGIDRQLILMHLLANERKLPLLFKGPYATLFAFSEQETEKTNYKDGFAIDVPIALDTVYASGYLLLKVITYIGPRLVFVDGRAGRSTSFETGIESSFVVAEDFGQTPKEKRQSGQRPIQLAKETISWRHTTPLGLYVDKAVTFV